MDNPDRPGCRLCDREANAVSSTLGICAGCIRTKSPTTRPLLEEIHARSRNEFDLPVKPPRDPQGIPCTLCGNLCVIGDGARGFCGLRVVRERKIVHLAGIPRRGLLQWYRDPLPTNCVADWVCEGHRQTGCHNLAVFYESCTANCLFCQNWHFREISPGRSGTLSSVELASNANPHTFCVCFFGGDPSSQIPHALAAAKLFMKRGVRVCWETNGMMNPRLLDVAVDYSARTGGCIKFDLKAFDEEIHRALTGVSNRQTLENFERAGRHFRERTEPPLVIASTLLVPGYVDADQVSKIAGFIASIDLEIPYALLAFGPHFFMSDLPYTSAHQAEEAETAAREAGLKNIRIGNQHLLGFWRR
jgi:pyruvate formate lyase activating enzyme